MGIGKSETRMPDTPEWVTVTPDEEILLQEQPAILPYLLTLVGEVVLIVLGLAIVVAGGIGALLGLSIDLSVSVLAISLSNTIAIILILLGVIGISRTMLRWWSTRYVITSEELYKKTGVVSRAVQNIRLQDVQNTSFEQSWFGRLASYGNVYIATAGTGGTEITFKHAGDPSSVVETITRQIDQQQR